MPHQSAARAAERRDRCLLLRHPDVLGAGNHLEGGARKLRLHESLRLLRAADAVVVADDDEQPAVGGEAAQPGPLLRRQRRDLRGCIEVLQELQPVTGRRWSRGGTRPCAGKIAAPSLSGCPSAPSSPPFRRRSPTQTCAARPPATCRRTTSRRTCLGRAARSPRPRAARWQQGAPAARAREPLPRSGRAAERVADEDELVQLKRVENGKDVIGALVERTGLLVLHFPVPRQNE